MGYVSRVVFTVLTAAFVCVLPARASAELFATPFAGVTFIDSENRKTTFGAAIGGGGLVSVEFEAARTLLGSYQGIPVVDLNARVSTFMGNVMIRVPNGFFQPYLTAGAGIVRLTGSVDVPFLGQIVSASADDLGWNFGGGLMLFPTPNLGVRGDIRRFQTGAISWDDITGIGGLDDIPLPKVDFWRATGGLTFKF
jgi:opacity protein-like surface antigen